MSDTDQTILVVGGGVAAGSTAAALRDEGHTGPVVVVTMEPRLPYERPALSKGLLLGEQEPETTYVHDAQWWAAHDVDVRTGRTVVDLGIDDTTGDHRAALDDGTDVAWDTAVLATGTTTVAPPFEGGDLDGVHQIRTIDDSLALRAALDAADRVVVVGASWIGSEAAAAARGHGCEVTLVDQSPTPMNKTLGDVVGEAYAGLHRDHGVTLHLGEGKAVERLTGDGHVDGVELSDGTRLEADVVVLGVGVQPVTGLAEIAGLEVDDDDGVLVDASLRTSHPDVLAVGDVAGHDHPMFGRIRAEHIEVARAHGVTAAKVITGQDARFDGLPLFYSDQYDLGMEYVGLGGDDTDPVVRGSLDELQFVAFFLDEDDVVRSGNHANTFEATDVIRELVGRTVDRSVLGDEDVALEDLPSRAVVDDA